MSTTDIQVGSVNLLDVITADRVIPEGYDEWAIRTVRPDLRSRNEYRYPFPGRVAKAAGPFRGANLYGANLSGAIGCAWEAGSDGYAIRKESAA